MMDLTHLNEDNMVIRYNNQRQNLLLLKHGLLILIFVFFSEARNLLYTVSNRWDNMYDRQIKFVCLFCLTTPLEHIDFYLIIGYWTSFIWSR